MRLIFLALASLPLLACGPGTADTTTGTNTSSAASTAASTATTTATSANSTAGTDEPTTTASMTASSGATSPATGTTTGEPNTTTAGPGSSATSDTSTDTGGGARCDSDADCMLADDCCNCLGVPVGADVAVCDAECKQSKCSELGIATAVCRLGVCSTPRLSCDGSKVACDSLPPPCPPGTLAETSPACWTGRCIPVEHCDVVPTCADCPGDRVCVQNVSLVPEPGVTCEPFPADCDPAKPCACIGDQVCLQPFGACIDQPGGDIACECPNC